MNIPPKTKLESLPEYAQRLSEVYSSIYESKIRKKTGQIFTPSEIGCFMSNLFKISKNKLNILDPGAGTGILLAALCEKLLQDEQCTSLNIDAYEIDQNILPFLKTTLEECKKEFKGRNLKFKYNIIDEDFILFNEPYFSESTLFNLERKYDLVISNPPYYKLRKDSPQSIAMDEIVFGQPNIYPFFMAIATAMSKMDSEHVFIVPRSFCSGLYYKKFRKWLLSNISIEHIHLFESRKEIFENDKILQETVIIKFNRTDSKVDKVKISACRNKNFENFIEFQTSESTVIYEKNDEIFIRIPTSEKDAKILEILDKWPKILKDLDLKISTGPVVPFRSKDFLLEKLTETPKSVPLLWIHNIQNMKIKWPRIKNKKESAIIFSNKSNKLLLNVKNYILISRFSSKEQDRRLFAGVLFKSDFPYVKIGIENHLNYIYRPEGDLSKYEALGIAALLNSRLIDNFFRSINGNTQVNANEIRILPFPPIEDIIKIGKKIELTDCINLDEVINETLGVSMGLGD